MAKATFRQALEVKKIAEDLIPKYHQHLIDFDVKLEYVFVDKTPKSKGQDVWGTCKKVSNLNAFLANEKNDSDPFFVLTVSEPIWDAFPEKSKIALVDFLLCHAWAEASQDEDDDGSDDVVKLSLNTYDVQDFACMGRRHGLWKQEAQDSISGPKD